MTEEGPRAFIIPACCDCIVRTKSERYAEWAIVEVIAIADFCSERLFIIS